MMGAPTVTATVAAPSVYSQLDMRLWDVLPGGQQRLISRGVYRLLPGQSGVVTTQLHANAYTFGDGDTIKLEVLGQDAPTYQADSAAYTLGVSNVTVSLPTAGTWDELVNLATGKCVDAKSWGTANGTTVQQWQCGSGQPNQEWQPQPAGGDNVMLLNRHAAGGGEVVDVSGGPTATGNGVSTQTWAYAAGSNQEWQLVPAANGYFRLVALHSGKCLDVPAANTANGVVLQQWACNGNAQQQFKLVPEP
jgi:hypothetical protein